MNAFVDANAATHTTCSETTRQFFKALDNDMEYADVCKSLESGEGEHFQVTFAFLVHVVSLLNKLSCYLAEHRNTWDKRHDQRDTSHGRASHGNYIRGQRQPLGDVYRRVFAYYQNRSRCQ